MVANGICDIIDFLPPPSDGNILHEAIFKLIREIQYIIERNKLTQI